MLEGRGIFMNKKSTVQDIIYIELLNEGVRVFRPVQTINLGNEKHIINEEPPSDETWAFAYGDIVIASIRSINGKSIMVATSLINESK